GLAALEPLRHLEGAKVLPAPDIGPMLAELQIHGDKVELVRTLALRNADGALLSGRAPLGDAFEPTFDIEGRPLPPDPAGADTEGAAALRDGSFWIAEEYGPSLLKVDAQGVVRRRWSPAGRALTGAEPRLPAHAGDRVLNRGFEGLAVSPDERWLYVALQSAPQGDDRGSAPIWKLDAATGAVALEASYPFDPPRSFTADAAAGDVRHRDLKICELACVGEDRLLVLERISRSARIYRVDLAERGPLAKTLVFSTDNLAGFAPDLEGMALLSDSELILSTDNDFGVEGARTHFYRLRFDAPLADPAG
ncbi:MAG TPA: esterase-like activity of phytase family protein, partial [Phenylobacterium sp.]